MRSFRQFQHGFFAIRELIRQRKWPLYSRSHSRVRERKAPGRAPADGAAGIALGRAGIWGQRPQLLSNVGVRTNGRRLFGSAEHPTGLAPADDAAGQAPKTTTRCGYPLGAGGAKRRTPVDLEYECMMRRLMIISECWQVFE
jgi:hypothetical protein